MKPQFLHDEHGKEKFVLLDVKTYRKLLDDLEDHYLDEVYRREKAKADKEGYVKWEDVKSQLAKKRKPHKNGKALLPK
jgi:hypothetical protein